MKKIKFVIAILTTLFLAACNTPERIAYTPSGRPEIMINSTDFDLVKSTIINEMQMQDFLLSDDSKYRLVFTKQMKGGDAALAQLAIGNSYSTTPVAEFSFNISQVGDQIKVIGFSSVSTQMAFGQVNRMDMKNNNAWFNDIQNLLQQVKYSVERQKS